MSNMDKKQKKELKRQQKKKAQKEYVKGQDSVEKVNKNYNFGKIQLILFVLVVLAGAGFIIVYS